MHSFPLCLHTDLLSRPAMALSRSDCNGAYAHVCVCVCVCLCACVCLQVGRVGVRVCVHVCGCGGWCCGYMWVYTFVWFPPEPPFQLHLTGVCAMRPHSTSLAASPCCLLLCRMKQMSSRRDSYTYIDYQFTGILDRTNEPIYTSEWGTLSGWAQARSIESVLHEGAHETNGATDLV